MRVALALILAVHALIHVLGFVKAFELAPVAQLARPIARPVGLLWLAATALLVTAAALLCFAPRWFWLAGALGLVASEVAILTAWSDARFGTLANVALLAAVVYGAFAWGPSGLRAEYRRLVRGSLAQLASAPRPRSITEADLALLPPLVQRYLRFAGVVGTPRVQGFRARLSGRIRSSAAAPWMPFVAEQHDFFDPPRRYFWMEATRGGLPLDVLHAYGELDARMRVRLLSLVPVVELSGAELMRTETVTVFNDLCVFAPGRLIDPSIRWRELDAHSVEATYTNGAHTIRAVLRFDDSGRLVDFWSDDRPALAEDGDAMLAQRWSTPLSEYRAMGPYRLASRGQARYAASDGEYTYIELEVREVSTELAPGGAGRE